MKQLKVYVLLVLCVMLYLNISVRADESNMTKPVEIAFPLPWRSERLIADAMNPKTPLSDIRAMLKNDDSSVRLEAVRTLGERGSQNDLPDLKKLANANDSTAAAAKIAIMRIKARMFSGMDEVEEITKFLISNNHREQLEAVIALGQIDTQSSTQKLITYLQTSNISPYNALRALVRVDKSNLPEAPSLIKSFFSKQTSLKNIVGGLGREKVSDNIDVKLANDYWVAIFNGISTQKKVDTFVREYAAVPQHTTTVPYYGIEGALSHMGTILEPLYKIVIDPQMNIFVKQAAIRILKSSNSPRAMDILNKLYVSQAITTNLRRMAGRMLVRLGDPKLIANVVAELHKDVGENVSATIVENMWTLNDATKNSGIDKKLVQDTVLPYLKQNDPKKGSDLASLILRRVGDDATIDPLITWVDYSAKSEVEPELHASAITSLGYVGARVTDSDTRTKVLFFLIHQCYDKDPVTRIVAVQALARMAGAEGIPVMEQMVQNEKDGAAMRFEISGIYKAGGPDAVTALEHLRQFAIDSQNTQMQELCEEGLLRLKREGRDKEVKPVTYHGDSGGLFE